MRKQKELLNFIISLRDRVDNLSNRADELDYHKRFCEDLHDVGNALEELQKMLVEGSNTYIILVDRETKEKTKKYFVEGDVDAICFYASKMYCFSDYDDGYEIEKIIYAGHELHYLGWQPGMVFEFMDRETGEIVYCNQFEHWDH